MPKNEQFTASCASHRHHCFSNRPAIALQILTTCLTQEFVGQSHDQNQTFPYGQTGPSQKKVSCTAPYKGWYSIFYEIFNQYALRLVF